jgi:hypothetical protein
VAGAELYDGEVAHRHGVEGLLDGIEGGPELGLR